MMGCLQSKEFINHEIVSNNKILSLKHIFDALKLSDSEILEIRKCFRKVDITNGGESSEY